MATLESQIGTAFTKMSLDIAEMAKNALNGDPTQPGGYLNSIKGGLYSGVSNRSLPPLMIVGWIYGLYRQVRSIGDPPRVHRLRRGQTIDRHHA